MAMCMTKSNDSLLNCLSPVLDKLIKGVRKCAMKRQSLDLAVLIGIKIIILTENCAVYFRVSQTERV